MIDDEGWIHTNFFEERCNVVEICDFLKRSGDVEIHHKFREFWEVLNKEKLLSWNKTKACEMKYNPKSRIVEFTMGQHYYYKFEIIGMGPDAKGDYRCFCLKSGINTILHKCDGGINHCLEEFKKIMNEHGYLAKCKYEDAELYIVEFNDG